jgi:hypothetical protein
VTRILVIGAIVLAFVAGWVTKPDRDGTCHAPCIVMFDHPMQEDEFNVDYAGERLRVTRSDAR